MSDKHPGARIDLDMIRKLADLLTEKNLTDIEVTDGGFTLKVSRTPPASSLIPAAASVAPQPPSRGPPAAAPPPAAARPAAEPETPARGGAAAGDEHPGAVTAPMVGTAYLSPEPGAEPFISVGDQVSEGQTLLIVEAMKIMNAISSPRPGTVRRILVENAQPVEFGETLVIIE